MAPSSISPLNREPITTSAPFSKLLYYIDDMLRWICAISIHHYDNIPAIEKYCQVLH